MTRKSETPFVAALPSSVRTIFCPFASSPKVTRLFGSSVTKATPFSTLSFAGEDPRRSAARDTRTAFASAAAARRAGPKNRVDIEP